MEIYLVGGAVRDELLGKPVAERDFVVVGATPEMMLAEGFAQVGKDFPVFLHPQTKEEYALARTERKSGPGYTGFSVYAAPNITLEEDLKRRDLTVNAIAKAANGDLIDPFGGRHDLENRVLRHVSDAFVEDPLRVLRVARFAARFNSDGFKVAPETMTLMQTIAKQGELKYLTAERVWREFERSLDSATPQVFINTLARANALSPWFAPFNDSEILSGIEQRFSHLDDKLPLHKLDRYQRLGLLTIDLEEAQSKDFRTALKMPKQAQFWVTQCAAWHRYFSARQKLSAQAPEKHAALLLKQAKNSAFFKPESPISSLFEMLRYAGHKAELLEQYAAAITAATQVAPQALIAQGYTGAELGKAIETKQIEILAQHAFD